MPRCIDADLMTADIQRYLCAICSIRCTPAKVKNSACEIAECLRMIDNAPTVDAEPVKHGRWIMVRKTKLIPTGYMGVVEGHVLTKTGADKPFTMQEANIIPLKAHKIVKIPYCSVCGNYGDDEYDKTPYCPNCGAKMDGDNNGKDNSC